MSLTVIIPAYNEEKMIEKTTLNIVNFLNMHKVDFEIIICINNSTDETENIAKRLNRLNSRIKFLSIPKKGFGIAIQEGIKVSKKDLIVYVPADDLIDYNFIINAMKQSNHYDVILGSRYAAGSVQLNANWIRKFLSRYFAKIVRFFISRKVTEFGTVKMFKADWAKKVVKECTSTHWDFQVEMLYFALRDKKSFIELPLKVNYKTDRQSKIRILSDIYLLLNATIKYGLKLRFG